MTKHPSRGAIVLCGGKSSRMGSDKATLPFGDELMLPRVVRILSQIVPLDSIVVVAAPDQRLPLLPSSVRVAHDEYPTRGPMEGMAAGWRALTPETQVAYTTSCDVPLLVPQFVEFLFEKLGEHDIAMPVEDGFHHPLSAVYRRTVLATIQSLLAVNQLRPRSLIDYHATTEVPTAILRHVDPDLTTLMNLNTPEAYTAALTYAQRLGDKFGRLQPSTHIPLLPNSAS